MKLTEVHKKLISEDQKLIALKEQELHQAKVMLTRTLFAIAGSEFQHYEIKDDELIIKDNEQ